MIAVLPMYDWPEVRAETDAQWVRMRDALREEGLDAPDELDRSVGYVESWSRDDLMLGQACGLPLACGLTGRAVLIGTIDFGLSGCAVGEYYSVIVARKDDPCGLEDLRSAPFAFNDQGSQSGYNCLTQLSLLGAAEPIETGSHRASIKTVADGHARFAAIDANTWRIALDHEPSSHALRVVYETAPTPAPVLLAHADADVAAYRRALQEFIVVRDRDEYLSLI